MHGKLSMNLIERGRELLNNCDDMEVLNLFTPASEYLQRELKISRGSAYKVLYHIEHNENKHWLRHNEYMGEFTHWMRENNCYCTQTEDRKKWRTLYYKYLKLNGKYPSTNNTPKIGELVYRLHGIKSGETDYYKYYSRYYKMYQKGELYKLQEV